MFGDLWAWGANNYGQLGLGFVDEQVERPRRLLLPTDLDVVSVVGGGGHSLLLDSQGRLYAAGWNHKGQLGLGSSDNVDKFEAVAEKVSQVAAGWDFTLVLLSSGKVLACGSNAFGQLGLGSDLKSTNTLQPLVELSDKVVVQVACGLRHSLFLTADGHVYGCGSAKKGQLGVRNNIVQHVPVKLSDFSDQVIHVEAGQYFSVLLVNGGKLIAFGDNKHGQLTVPDGLRHVKTVTCGWTHVVALDETGTVHTWGRNDYGQLGGKEEESNDVVEKVSSGYEHVLAVHQNGSLYSWGWNEHCNCGLGHTDNVLVPTKVDFDKKSPRVLNPYACSGHSFALAEKQH